MPIFDDEHDEHPGSRAVCARKGTGVTELIYGEQIRPVIQSGAVAMDRIFER
jgi:hypothetical protein